MEGDGEGMVAIVQGVNETGVTLTVVNRRPEMRERRGSPKPKRTGGLDIALEVTKNEVDAAIRHHDDDSLPTSNYNHQNGGGGRFYYVDTDGNKELNQTPMELQLPMPSHRRSSAETNTKLANTTTTGAQICDGRYASSYRLAHCRMTPTSPPERVSEFPPQRKEPCRNRGNFEVGGHGSAPFRTMSARSRYFGGTAGSQTWVDKGTVHRSKSSRATDAFAHSLRKYPSMTPVRTVSTDLIEKLLRYTQAKNTHEQTASRITKSMRSLHKERSSDTSNVTKASKHQQTYTRVRNNETGAKTSGQLGYKGRTRNFKLYSPMSDSRNIKFRGSPYSTSYDYLNAASSRRYVRPDQSDSPDQSERDVRLADVSRYIRSTIRQIYSERPVVFQVCPKMKNRYNLHKKTSCTARDSENMMNDADDQAGSSVLSRILASISGCGVPFTAAESTSPDRSYHRCCCNKVSQYSCKPDASTSTLHVESKASQPSKSKYCHCCPNTRNKFAQEPLKSDSASLTEEVGVCNCAEDDKAYFNRNIDEVISNWLRDVPVYNIESAENKIKRENMVMDLRKILKQLPDDTNFEENAKKEIDTFIDNFPMWCPGTKLDEELFKQQLADKLLQKIKSIPRKPDRFKEAVKKLFKDMNFESSTNINTEAIIDNFANTLKTMAADRPKSDSKYKEDIIKEIVKTLEQLPLRIQGNKDKILNQMANNLATEIVSIPKDVNLTEDRVDLKDDFEENILDWLKDINLIRDNIIDLKADPKLIDNLAVKLSLLQSQGIDDNSVLEKMNEEILKFMADVDIAVETLDELINDLTNRLTETVQAKEIKSLDKDELSEEIIDWLRKLPGVSELHPRKFDEIAKKLLNKIQDVKHQSRNDYLNDIIDYLAHANIQIDPVVLAKHIEELMEIIEIWPSNKQYKENVKEKMLTEFHNVIDNSSIPKNSKKELKSKLTGVVANNLDLTLLDYENGQDNLRETLLERIDSVIDELQIPTDKSEIRNQLSDALIKHFDKLFPGVKKDRRDLKQTVTKDVSSMLKKLPISRDKKKDLIQQVKDVLVKNLDKPLPNGIRDTIKNEINKIIDVTPIFGDETETSDLKKKMANAVEKVLGKLPSQSNSINDIKDRLFKDISNVVDKSTIDEDDKRDLKLNVQSILSSYRDQHSLDEVKESLKEDIINAIEDLSLPEDKMNDLKNEVDDTVIKSFDNVLSTLRMDINKIKDKLVKDIYKAIEKSPIDREQKTHLKTKLKGMLSKNLDSSISDEEKETIIDDISNIISGVPIPKVKRSDLKNKLANTLAKKLDVPVLKKYDGDVENEIKRIIIDIIDEAPIPEEKKNKLKLFLEDKLNQNFGGSLSDIIKELHDIIEHSSIHKDKKNDFKSKLTNVLAKYSDEFPSEKNTVDDFKNLVTTYINRAINKLSVDPSEKKKIKSMVKDMLSENLYRHLSDEVKGSIKADIINIMDDIPVSKDKKNDIKTKLTLILSNNLEKLPNQAKNVGYIKDAITEDVSHIIDDLMISRVKKHDLIQKVKLALSENIDRNLNDEKKKKIIEKLYNIFDNLPILENEKRNIKDTMKDIVSKKERVRGSETSNVKKDIENIENIIDSFAIDPDKKKYLKKDVRLILNETLYQPLSDEVKQNVKYDIADIIDDITIPEHKKKELKAKIQDALADNLEELITEGKDVNDIKNTIAKNISSIIDSTSLSHDKKKYLKRKVDDALTENLLQPMTNDVRESIKEGIRNIIDDSNISKDTDTKNFEQHQLPKDDKAKIETSILQGIDSAIDKSLVPQEKQLELKTKLKQTVAEHLKDPLPDNFYDAIIIDINSILNEIPLNKVKKELKRTLIDMVDEHIKPLLDNQKANNLKELKIRVEDNILEGIESIIEQSPISKENKTELKKKLTDMTSKNFRNPLLNDVRDSIKEGISNILDESPLSICHMNNLEYELTGMVDKNMESLCDSENKKEKETRILQELETHAEDNILQGIETTIEQSSIPEEKKMGLKEKLKELVSKYFTVPLLDDAQETVKDGINSIFDELPLAKAKKDTLKNELTEMVNDNMESLNVKKNIATSLSMDKVHKKSMLPVMKLDESLKEETDDVLNKEEINADDRLKLEEVINNELKDLVVSDGDITSAKKKIKQKIIQDMHYPDDQAGDLSRKFIDKAREMSLVAKATDSEEYNEIKMSHSDSTRRKLIELSDKEFLHGPDKLKLGLQIGYREFRDIKNRTQDNILRGMENAIEKSPISKEKKGELKKKLKEMMAEIFEKQQIDDIQDSLEDCISNILDELPLPIDEKIKLTLMVDENMESLRNNIKEKENERLHIIQTSTQDDILQGIENTIEQAPIPSDKKLELKEKLKKMATENFKAPLFGNAQDSIKDGISTILDELPLSEDKKNNLKNELTKMVDGNVDSLRDIIKGKGAKRLQKLETRTENNILRGFDDTIEQADIHTAEKLELKEKLKEMASENFKKGISSDTQVLIKDGINTIVDDSASSKNNKDKLKNELTELVDDNMQSLRDDIKGKDGKRLQKLRTLAKSNISQDFEDTIEQAPIPTEKQLELNKQLKEMAPESFKKGISCDTQDLIDDEMRTILDDLSLSKDSKDKLETELTDSTDEKLKGLRGTSGKTEDIANLQELETCTQDNILQGIESTVERSLIPKEKKIELINKLRDMAATNFGKPLNDDVQDSLKDGISNILDELPLSKSKKDKLKNKLTEMVDDNMESMRVKKYIAISYDKANKERKSLLPQMDVDKSLKEEIEDLFVQENVDANDVEKFKEDIMDELKDLVVKYGDIKGAKKNIEEKIKQNLNLSEDKISDLSNRLIGRTREMSLVAKANDSDIYNKSKLIESDPLRREITELSDKEFLEGPEKLIINQKVRPSYDSDNEDIRDESLTETSIKETKDIVNESSVPTDIKDVIKLQQEQDFTKDVEKLDDMTPKLMPKATTRGEYTEELQNSVKSWIDKLSIDLDPEEKANIMHDLAAEIVDRQKYFQVIHSAKTSDREELDNLKYQLFRRLRKVTTPAHLAILMHEADELFEIINKLNVPVMVSKLHLLEQKG